MTSFGQVWTSNSRPRWLIALVAWLCLPAGSRADVGNVEVKDMAAYSELIVVAKVSKIEAAPANLKRDDAGMPPLKIDVDRLRALVKHTNPGK